MEAVVLFGIGSQIVGDVEESLARAGCTVAAAIRNVAGEVYLQDVRPLVELSGVTVQMKALPYLVPLFTPGHRQSAVRVAQQLGFARPFSLIDPTATRPRSLTHGPGLYVNAGCNLGAGCMVDEYVFINRGVNLGHHARLGRFVSIGPGAVVAGLATLGAGVVIGAGAVILPKISIGANAVVGAGAAVTKDVPEHCLVVGNPARIVRTGIPGYANQSVS